MRKRIALCMAALVLALLGPGMALVVSRSFGLTMERERARALIGIAHPDFRAELTDQAGRLGLV